MCAGRGQSARPRGPVAARGCCLLLGDRRSQHLTMEMAFAALPRCQPPLRAFPGQGPRSSDAGQRLAPRADTRRKVGSTLPAVAMVYRFTVSGIT